MVDRKIALDLYNKGETLQSIANKYGVSRQRIWQVLKPQFSSITYNHTRAASISNPRPAEIYVMDRLKKLGVSVESMPYNHPFDILANGKKIEVKHRSKAHPFDKRLPKMYFNFKALTYKEGIDFVIFVVGELDNPVCYIVSKQVTHFAVPQTPSMFTKNQRLYRENWDSIVRE